nr:MAG TPA: hypothetical protein [Bacteriophage sp.]
MIMPGCTTVSGNCTTQAPCNSLPKITRILPVWSRPLKRL